LIDLQKLPSLSQDERERLEAFAEKFERIMRDIIAAAKTAEDKQAALEEVERLISEFQRAVQEHEKPH
jgi:hypothetical protein